MNCYILFPRTSHLVFLRGLFLNHRGFRNNEWRSWEGVGVILHSSFPMSSSMSLAVQPHHSKRNKGLPSCFLLHMRLHLFTGLPTSVTYKLLELTAVTQPALLPIPTTFPIIFPQIFMWSVISLAHTTYPPLPDTAWFSSDRFNLSECRPSKTNILAIRTTA